MSKLHDATLAALKQAYPAGTSLQVLTAIINLRLASHHSHASISARIRDLRKPKYGGHSILRMVRNKQHYYCHESKGDK